MSSLSSLPIGELAALGTSLCWTTSAFFFAAAAQRIGPLAMNMVRVTIALGMLSVMVLFVRGTPLPTDASAEQLTWLGLSGLVGLVFGDLCLFRAYVEIGARRAMLLQTTAPIFTALLGWAFLGERPRPMAAAGTALVLLGVAWAIKDRSAIRERAVEQAIERSGSGSGSGSGSASLSAASPPRTQLGNGSLGLGVVLALGAALGQAGGLILAKLGMHGYHPIAATQVRMISAVIGFALVVTAVSAWPRVREALRQRQAVGFTAGGALFGPSIGVSLSLVAVTHTQAGIAAALMATTQVWMAIATVVSGREKVGVGGIGGAVLAVSGVVLLVAA